MNIKCKNTCSIKINYLYVPGGPVHGKLRQKFHTDSEPKLELRAIPRFDLSEFANFAEYEVFCLGDRIHPGVITAVITRLQVLEQYLKILKFATAVHEYWY